MRVLGTKAAQNIKNFFAPLASQTLGYTYTVVPGAGGSGTGGAGDITVEALSQVAVYKVSAYRTANISQVTVKNLSASTITYDLGVVDFGTALTSGNSLKWDESIAAGATVTISNITNQLTAGKTIYVFPSSVDTVEVKVYGTQSGTGTFAAVSSLAEAATTTNGITWTQRTLPSSESWSSIAYGNGIYATVVSNAAKAAYSADDGVTWTARTLPGSDGYNTVFYGNGVFVALKNSVMANSQAATSTNGITWTTRTLPSSSAKYAAGAYGNGIYAVTCSGSTTGGRSTDAITWTERTLPGSNNYDDVSYGNGVFLALASNNNSAATSTDGITWTARTKTGSFGTGAPFGNGVFFYAAGLVNTGYSSTDGITWTQRTMPATIANTAATAFGNGIFVVVTSSSTGANGACTSTDAITWTLRSVPLTYTNFTSITSG